MLDQILTEDLARFTPSRRVLQALIERGGRDEARAALVETAKLNRTDPTAKLLASIQAAQESVAASMDTLVALMSTWDPAGLRGARAKLEEFALGAKTAQVRRGAFAALMRADGSSDQAWWLATRRPRALVDFVEAASLMPDADLPDALYAKIKSLLERPLSPVTASDAPGQADRIQRASIRALAHFDDHAGESFRLLAELAKAGTHRGDVLAVMADTPKEHWAAEQAVPLVDTLLRYTATVPEAERDQDACRTAVAFGQELVGLLPQDRAKEASLAFETLVVQTIHIIALPKELRFDKLSFSVEAGRPVEIVFDNPDEMPHNLLITKPGALKEVAEAGDAMATQPDAFEKQFVPDTPSVLWATPLLNKGESFRLRFTAPSEQGGYPYVCTFPGHWITMNGIMYMRPWRR